MTRLRCARLQKRRDASVYKEVGYQSAFIPPHSITKLTLFRTKPSLINMSFVIIPSNAYGQGSAAAPSSGRCGPSLFPFGYHRSSTAIPRDFLGALFGDQDADVIFDEAPSLTPWQEIHSEQLRRQEYLEEVDRRRRRIQEARQKQIDLERRIEQARREKEKAARLAWHQEQQREAALALEYRRRLEAHKRRQQEEYAQQVRLAQQEYLARQAEQAREARHAEQAARLAQQSQQKEVDWEHLATQSIFGVLDLVQHLFGDEEDKSHSKVDGKKGEKTTEEVNAEQAKQKDVDADAMLVDQPEVVTKPNNVEQGPEADKAVDPEQASKEVDDKQGEMIAVKAQEEQATVTSPENHVKANQEQESKAGHLIFTYPLPHDEAARSSIKAQDIGVSYDEASHTIQLTGLWPNNSASASSSSSHEENRGRTRSRSPKRSRVSDVDEKTGEEIVKADENDEGFVEIPKVQQATTTTPNTTTKSIRLPQDATVTNLRAELTDDGFKVFV